MHLDVRLPIGLMFLIIGVILSIYGLTTGPELYRRSLNINVNLLWGVVQTAFGAIMLYMAWRASRKQKEL
jgi:hypothetical protein